MPVSLWEFASSCYQYPGIAETCLTLQDDADADINMLLAAAWLAADARHWQIEDVETITQACRHWRNACLLPLRQIRRDLKTFAAADNWYQRIKVLELEAERYQLRLIEEAVVPAAGPPDTGDKSIVVTANLGVYFTTLPAIASGHCLAETTLLTQLLIQSLGETQP